MNLKKRYVEFRKFLNVHVRFESSSHIRNIVQKPRASLSINNASLQLKKKMAPIPATEVNSTLPTRLSTAPIYVAHQILGQYLRDDKTLLAHDLFVLRFRHPMNFLTLQFNDIYSLLIKLLALPHEHRDRTKEFIKHIETSGVPRLKVSPQMYEKIIIACVNWGDLRYAIEIWNKLTPSERTLSAWKAMLKLYLKTGLSLSGKVPGYKVDVALLDDETIDLVVWKGRRDGMVDAGLTLLVRAATMFKAMIARLRDGAQGNNDTPDPDVDSILLGIRVLTALADVDAINEVFVVSMTNIALLQIPKETAVNHDSGTRDRSTEKRHALRSGAATIIIERVVSALVSLQKYSDVEAIVCKYIAPRLLARRQDSSPIDFNKHVYPTTVCSFGLPDIDLDSHYLDCSRSSDSRTLRYLIQMCKKKQDPTLASFYWFLFVDPPSVSYPTSTLGPDLGTCAAFLSLFGRPPIDGQISIYPMDLATAEEFFAIFCGKLKKEGLKGVKYLQEGLLQARFAAGEYEGCEKLYKDMCENREFNGGISGRVLILMRKIRELTNGDVDGIPIIDDHREFCKHSSLRNPKID
ncbi:hypothetical protein HK096_003855 [Nowakowskiella sp. JEL0078]|nr:hypothetical protein HK096_003855 [Nowakowskiella sp. JEL0078]